MSAVAERGRIRQIIDTTDTMRRALKLRTMKLGVQRLREVTVSEFLNELLEQELAEEIKEIEKDDAEPESPKPRRKRHE